MLHYTGLPDHNVFNAVLSTKMRFEITYYFGWTVSDLTMEDQLLLCLMKLRMNLSNMDLAVRFGISDKCVLHAVVYSPVCAVHCSNERYSVSP